MPKLDLTAIPQSNAAGYPSQYAGEVQGRWYRRHPGDVAAFPKNDGNGHCLINESGEDCVFLVIGKATNGPCHYPDVDMREMGGGDKRHKDGSPFTG